MESKKILIFIPTYNACKTITKVLDRIPTDLKNKVAELLVSDDGSSDNTFQLVLDYKKINNVKCLKAIKHETNKGYGKHLKWAYQYAISEGFDIVVNLHGDGQYAPEKLQEMIEPLENNSADMVMGSRILGNEVIKGGMPFEKIIGNRLLTGLGNLFLGTKLSEYHSGYRAYSCHALRKVPFMSFSNTFVFDIELMIELYKAGMRIKEIPIPTFYGEEISHVKIFSYGLEFLHCVLKNSFKSKKLM